ncbi:methyltransferase-domain-containing protein [Lipomyces arxii]|uniref:methyltransferase-domain-containing protein n=1 Tax=Lipomyces arxii TaxID=56418 RepID=UPI0034CFBB2B
MSLFEVEGWTLSTPVKSGNEIDSKISKRGRNKRQKRIEETAVAEKEAHVSSQELQNLFDSQFETKKTEQEKEKEGKNVKVKRKRESNLDVSEQIEKDVKTVKPIKPAKSGEPAKPGKQTAEKAGPVSSQVAKTVHVVKLTPLQQKMKDKLTGSRFRWINEKLYTVSSADAQKLISAQPGLYNEYHEGFRNQTQSWPENPVNVFADKIKTLFKTRAPPPNGLPRDRDGATYIADMGCGDAELAAKVASKNGKKKFGGPKVVVHSFDLAKTNERVTVADIKHVPLSDSSVHIVVFCLSLMGTNFLDFIKEAHRIMKPRGQLWIAEIKSRFADAEGEDFINAVKRLGFVHSSTDSSNLMFIKFEFYKPLGERSEARAIKDGQEFQKKLKFIEKDDEVEEKKGPILKPCLYKKR